MKAIAITRLAPKVGHNYLFNTDSSVLVDAARDVVTPGGMISGNRINPNPWSYTTSNINYWHGERFEENAGNGKLLAEFHGSFGSNNMILPSDVISVAPSSASVYNRALDKLNRKTRGDMDLSVDLFQGRQNIRMFGGIKNVIKVAANPAMWKNRKTGEVIDTAGLANGYLQFKYGWKPLIQDVYDIADESVRHVLNKIQRFKASVSQPYSVALPVSRTIDGVANCSGNCIVRGKRAVTISVTLEVPGFDLARWATLNPVGLAWELIPYSFVVDWFYDVGSYLHNLETACLYDLRVKTGYVSDLLVMDSECTLVNRTGFVSGPSRHKGSFTTDFRHRVFSRTVSTSYPLPRRPTLKVDLSSSQCNSAAALLRQTLERTIGARKRASTAPRRERQTMEHRWETPDG